MGAFCPGVDVINAVSAPSNTKYKNANEKSVHIFHKLSHTLPFGFSIIPANFHAISSKKLIDVLLLFLFTVAVYEMGAYMGCNYDHVIYKVSNWSLT